MNDHSTASDQLKHQIKTLLSLPPHPQNKHMEKSRQGPKQQSNSHCHCSMVSGLRQVMSFWGLLPSPRAGKDRLPWSHSRKDPRQGRKATHGSQEMLGHGGPCTSKGGHTALRLPTRSPPPHLLLHSGAPVLALSLSLSLCFYVCSEGAIQSGRASWWEWWLLTPFSPIDRRL